MNKMNMDLEISFQTGFPQNTVKKITAIFVDLIREGLVNDGFVDIMRLGSLRVAWWRGPALVNDRLVTVDKSSVVLKKGTTLRRQLKEKMATMEKYGVQESLDVQDDVKISESRTTCPKCGAGLEYHGKVRKCPKCGTEPWEQEEE